MFSHIFVGTSDMDAAKRFYDATLGTLGVAEGVTDPKGRLFYRTATGTFGVSRPINGEAASGANGGTIGFAASSPEEVKAWHAAGLAHGGTAIEDPPGDRGKGLWLAYLRDPSGNKVCALCRVKS
ncbi:VOC family protein [Falsigemmobacter faecalis]|uniref:VOC family protein n=1 Tax=Falsigemmobacter faecalis TaxID=2488730 RepID=A0A3P3D9U7_9RHOB|nr:VOC family protein [Falsigemmobacter faecalis]RRH70212.1 VOC family protein [Falsigemmobacter faecalis]